MLLKINQNGQLVQADPSTISGEGCECDAIGVAEETMIVNPATVIQNQRNARAKAQILAARSAFMEQQRREQARARMIGEQQRRLEIMSGQINLPSRDELLILRESRKNSFGYADFSQMEQFKSSSDFGSLADFQQYSTYGNPLTPDGSIGPVTDYERFVLGNPFNMPIARGDMGTMPSGTILRNFNVNRPLVKRRVVRRVKNAHPLMAGFGDDTTTNTFDVGPAPSTPPDPNAPPPGDLTAIAPTDITAADLANLEANTGLPPTSSYDMTSQTVTSQPAAQSPSAATPSWWQGLITSAEQAIPGAVSNLTRQSSGSGQAVMPPSTLPANQIQVPLLKINVSKPVFYIGMAALSVGVILAVRNFKKSHRASSQAFA